MIQIEPLRAVISQGIVALLAMEIFEIFTLRIVDSLQEVIRSPLLSTRIRSLCSYQSIDKSSQKEFSDLIRLWLPLILSKIGPSLRPQLINLFNHALQKNLKGSLLPNTVKNLGIIEKAESIVSEQLAIGMVDTILELSRNTGNRLREKDILLEKLSVDVLDKFWEELASVLEEKQVLEKSQKLLLALLEDLKRSSFRQLKNQGGVNDLITELEGLNFSSTKSHPTNQV